jgi:hypothetical protein
MKRLIISSVVVVGELTGCAADRMDGRSEAGMIAGDFLLILFVGVVLYLAFSGVVALMARRSPRTGQSFDLVHAQSARHRRDRRRPAESGGGPDDAIPRDALTSEPERRLRAP